MKNIILGFLTILLFLVTASGCKSSYGGFPKFSRFIKNPEKYNGFRLDETQWGNLQNQFTEIEDLFPVDGISLHFYPIPGDRGVILIPSCVQQGLSPCTDCRAKWAPVSGGKGGVNFVELYCFCVPKNAPGCNISGSGGTVSKDSCKIVIEEYQNVTIPKLNTIIRIPKFSCKNNLCNSCKYGYNLKKGAFDCFCKE